MNTLTLPDVALHNGALQQTLDWVGMQRIALPLRLAGQPLAGRASAAVSLDDPGARGIHMSRLYLALEPLEGCELDSTVLRRVLERFLASHQGLARQAYLDLSGELLLKRPALVSPLAGWKGYPVALRSRLDAQGGFHVELQLEIGYSSTCPCSAALARQLIQRQFSEYFAGKSIDHAGIVEWLGDTRGILATPHSQRSSATLQVRLSTHARELPVLALIEHAEQALGTVLQTAVKRADEQAFALANGQNLMFCEDAARRLHAVLRAHPGITAFHLQVVHAESLHAHDAVACSSWQW
ncbi:GTP cyclohydrolase I FolE2 [Pseudomonas sp. R-28-1W-6]|uniref:GTP cyclohydrolase FolE2 n=1 Tax=Pseudomonas sp. R-28-1W-6 TaxID=2650101 RepID=UPI0013655801|nr:GTP cyclohydrolase FolE2 [Pseudomonas sp. R-28-1W-6]MWV10812.1 GTP cyclohydrolase I FolE2 [Pseudomonas sp. R-28-1W-6]